MRSMSVAAALLVAVVRSLAASEPIGPSEPKSVPRVYAVAPPQGVFTVRGGGDLDWQPSLGGFGPTTASTPTSASGTLSDPNGSAAYSIAAGPGVVRGSLAGSFTSVGRFNPSLQADAASELTLVGPIGFVAIPVSLNLHVDSTFTVQQCPDSCNISIGVLGHGGTTRFSIGAGFTENGLGLTADPIPGGYHLHGDVATPTFGLTPNLPTSVGISLQINDNNLNRGFSGASVFAVGQSTVSFSPSGLVLSGVPAPYTVSGPSVVDNHWTDPFRMTVTAISPSAGTTAGGTAVTITGTNFLAPATVTLGGTAATAVSVVDSTTITATTPPHAAGAVDVVVQSNTQSATLTNGYVYSTPARFYTLPPCRLIDTRYPATPDGLGGPVLASSPSQRSFTLTNVCGIPPTATALSVNVTVEQQTAPGFLSLFPGNGNPPPTSSINFAVGQTRANNAMVILATDGTGVLRVLNGAAGTVHFILDVNGYLE